MPIPGPRQNESRNRTMGRCDHCRRWRYITGRGLCRPCFADANIRCLYQPDRSINDTTPKLVLDLSKLPSIQTVPDFCCHQRRDGECPECEKKQRSRMIFEYDL